MAGLDPGSLHRADSYSESNVTLVLQGEKDKCDAMVSAADRLTAQTDPVFAESLRMWVQQCAAPDGGTWETGY